MLSSTSLLSLNEDVLREILAHVLLDTLCEPNRAAVLSTCSVLHDLGLPYLYRVVELRGYVSERAAQEQLATLFGTAGLFTAEGEAGGELGRFVRVLRLETVDVWFQVSHALQLPTCTSLILHLTRLPTYRSTFHVILGQLPITRLVLVQPSTRNTVNTVSRTFGGNFGTAALKLSRQPSAWDHLETIVFDSRLWYDEVARPYSLSLSLANWIFTNLVVRIDVSGIDPFNLKSEGDFAARLFFFVHAPLFQPGAVLRQTVRLEIRLRGTGAAEVEQGFRARVDKLVARGLSAFEKRVAKMIVFVGEDGQERKLLEDK